MGKVITILSSKGGVGKTTLGVNLAVSLIRESQKRVALIDLDSFSGKDVITLFGLEKPKSLFSIIKVLDNIDVNLMKTMKGFLTTHSSGVIVMPLMNEPREAYSVEPVHVNKLIHLFREAFDFVIIDTKSVFNNLLVNACDKSNLHLILTYPDVLSLKQTSETINTLIQYHFSPQTMKVVLNRSNLKKGLTDREVEASLGQPLFYQIPDDPVTAIGAINKATPFVISDPRSDIGKAVREFAVMLAKNDSVYSETKTGEVLISVDGTDSGQSAAAPSTDGHRPEAPQAPQEEKVSEKQKEILALKMRVHRRLVEEMDLSKVDLEIGTDPQKAKEIKDATREAIEKIFAEEGQMIASREERARLVQEILDEVLGLGPLEDLLADKNISEIMVNGKDKIYVERAGKLTLTGKKFASDEQLMAVIERIVAPLGRRVDESVPMVDARLKDGSRVNAIIPPLSLIGPMLTIRKFMEKKLVVEDLMKFGSMNRAMADFLKICVLSRKNIIISGGTGSGKTTLLNVLSSFIPSDERIITVEDSAELRLPQEHVGRLESRPANIEGKGQIAIRDLVRNCLRMRPDRIVVGECRGGETLDMLQAMNTGHDGSLTTVHANTPRDCLSRVETMTLMAGMELPARAIREQVASAVNIIIQQSRMQDGTRKITYITEITGMESDISTIQDIFLFKQIGLDDNMKVVGKYVSTGFVPRFIEEVKAMGIAVDMDIFKEEEDMH